MLKLSAQVTLFASAALLLAACGKERTQDDAGMSSAAATPAGAPADAADSAEYTVIFRSTWTKANHPFEYPQPGALTGPHFSGIIGASHNAQYTLFRDGTTPTPGLERLSEEGKHAPLDSEIRGAIASGSAGTLFESGPLRDFADSIVATVRVDAHHPLVSLVAMVAPSPDWFTGVSNLNLMENGQWVASRTVELNAWDSGGDEGVTYKAPDKDNNPKKPTSKAATRHFVSNGVAVPVATVTFIRK